MSVIESLADTLMSKICTGMFQVVEAKIFLYVIRIVSKSFEISPLDYASVLEQKH